MAYTKENFRKVIEAFQNKRSNAAAESERRKAEVEAIIPELADIDRELSAVGTRVFRAAIGGGDIDSYIAELKEENKYLRKKRAMLLEAEGFPPDYTDIRYECTLCNDSGYVGTQMCTCMKSALVAGEIEASGIGHLMSEQSFETFSIDYYSGVERDTMERNLAILKKFAVSFSPDTKQNWLLLGGTGLGKTHLSTSVAKVVIERGYSVVYDTMQNIMASYEEQRFGDGHVGDGSTDKYIDCDLLIIDDMGTEMGGQFTVACLYNLINSRINRRKPVIASTNLTQAELRSRYSDRITSRLFGEYRPLVFMGRDIRAQKLLKK